MWMPNGEREPKYWDFREIGCVNPMRDLEPWGEGAAAPVRLTHRAHVVVVTGASFRSHTLQSEPPGGVAKLPK